MAAQVHVEFGKSDDPEKMLHEVLIVGIIWVGAAKLGAPNYFVEFWTKWLPNDALIELARRLATVNKWSELLEETLPDYVHRGFFDRTDAGRPDNSHGN